MCIGHRCHSQSRPLHDRALMTRMAKVEGGFPHSEIRGSKPVRGSPRLIAAYHVLHRLSAPRHPPDTLMTLDHSHHRCPSEGHRRQGFVAGTKPGSTQRVDPKTFASEHVRDGGRSASPSPGPASRDPSHDGKGSRTASARRSRPLRRASLASRPTPRVGHIHSSRCRTTGSPEGERRPGQRPGDAPAGCAGGEFSMMRTGSKARVGFARPSAPITVPRTMVEQDGIEPTTSCLQSTRSTD